MELGKQARTHSLVIVLDIVGFSLLVLGAAMIRFAREELFAILGGFVLAGGVTVLSATRLVK